MSRLRKRLGKVALWTTRLRPLGAIVGLLFQRLAPLLPLKYILKDRHFAAFRHPVPIAPGHLLIVPLRRIASSLSFLSDAELCEGILAFAQRTIDLLPAADFSLSTNIGCRQEVKQVHFHLVPAQQPFERSRREPRAEVQLPSVTVREIESPNGLSSIECWFDAAASRRQFSEGIAAIVASLSPAISRFKGATVFLYFSAAPGKSAASRTIRIVIDNESRRDILDGVDFPAARLPA